MSVSPSMPESTPPPLPDQSEKIQVQCPVCGKKYRVSNTKVGLEARCTCGEVFQITPADMVIPLADEVSPQYCPRHPSVAATRTCSRCGASMCQTCAFPRPDGTAWCPLCATSVSLTMVSAWAPPPAAVPVGTRCQRHPNTAAVYVCTTCKAPMCGTCAFAFPGGIFLCPTCATTSHKKLSGKRKGMIVAALAIASWCTLGLILLFSGALASFFQGMDVQAAGIVLSVLVFVPSIIGGGIGISCFERRLANPPIVWVAAIWNGILMAIWLLLIVIGSLR